MDTHGSVVHYAYTPFGTSITSAPSESSLGFSSEFHDDTLALVYYNYRHYAFTDGRWTTQDPISVQFDVGDYAFNGNDSVNYVDTLGLLICATFDREKGVFTIRDEDTQETITVVANSGGAYDADGKWMPGNGEPPQLSIPAGKWVLVSDLGNVPENPFYGLFKMDETLDDRFYDDESQKKRTGVRSHLGSYSHGCITIRSDQQDEWKRIIEMINRTKPRGSFSYGRNPFRRTTVIDYGTVTVIGASSTSSVRNKNDLSKGKKNSRSQKSK